MKLKAFEELKKKLAYKEVSIRVIDTPEKAVRAIQIITLRTFNVY